MIKETHKKIITLILGIIITFFGVKTFYLIFLVESNVPEKTEQVEVANEFDVAREIIKNIVYIPGDDGVYKEEELNLENINHNILIKYLMYIFKDSVNQDTPPEEFLLFKEEHCTESKECVFISKEYVNYNSNITFGISELEYIQEEGSNCIYTESDVYCAFLKESDVTKISLIEGYKEAEDSLYIYERPAFLSGLEITKENDMYIQKIKQIRKTSIFNTDENVIVENTETSSLDEDYKNIVINKFKDKLYLYKHTFKRKNSNELEWAGTKIENSLNE